MLALDAFADRTGDSTFRAYARAGAARLRELTANGARPLPRSSDESATHETGFLSGSAGAAFVFLERYRRDRDPADLETARRLLAWVNDQAVAGPAGAVSWPFADHAGAWTASGFELGVAGIAWVNLQAARRPATPPTASVARRAGSWLRQRRRPRRRLGRAARRSRLSAARRSRQRRRRDRLGARGPRRRGHRHDGQPRAARSALAGLRAEARRDRLGAFWYESRTAQADGCAPSRRGTGARPGSPRSRRGSPAGPD